MPGFISYSLENDRLFKAGLDRAYAVVNDLREPFKLIALDFYRSEKAIFNLKGPGRYPPFKNSIGKFKGKTRKFVTGTKSPYQKFKIRKYGFDYPLLKAKGDLEKSVTSSTGPGSILAIDAHFLAIGTSLPYAHFHQDGTKNMAMRKFMFIGPEAPEFANSDQAGRLKRWLNILNSYVLRQMGATYKQSRG
jgi:phage gpG-like protein